MRKDCLCVHLLMLFSTVMLVDLHLKPEIDRLLLFGCMSCMQILVMPFVYLLDWLFKRKPVAINLNNDLLYK